jgi:hypothetical protein
LAFGKLILIYLPKAKDQKPKTKTMKCEDLQLNLPIYIDDVLTDEERQTVEAHLSACPVCRYKLADFQELRNNLRFLARPEMSPKALDSVKIAVAAEMQKTSTESRTKAKNDLREWAQMRLMPFGVGVFTSLILGFTLLWSLLSPTVQINRGDDTAQADSAKSPILLANANSKGGSGNFELSPVEYAQTRLAVSGESPSVNPKGALVALTKSLVRGNMKDEEVVVVADVFGDGLAQIAEVVEPSHNRKAVYELERALKTDATYAPFVPANLDRRSDSVRVVFKLQSVDVKTNLNSANQ